MASFSFALSTFARRAALPAPFSGLWLRLQELYPALHSEYVQVLVAVVVPLVLLLLIFLIDLKSRRKVSATDGAVTFRPSLAVRCTWILAILALSAHALTVHDAYSIIIVAVDLLAILELLRTFPRKLSLIPEGVRWHSFTGQIDLPWEHISCFARRASRLGMEYALSRNDGKTFVINSMVLPSAQLIVNRIHSNLIQRHLDPASAEPRSTLDTLHRLLLPACLVVIIFGSRFLH